MLYLLVGLAGIGLGVLAGVMFDPRIRTEIAKLRSEGSSERQHLLSTVSILFAKLQELEHRLTTKVEVDAVKIQEITSALTRIK